MAKRSAELVTVEIASGGTLINQQKQQLRSILRKISYFRAILLFDARRWKSHDSKHDSKLDLSYLPSRETIHAAISSTTVFEFASYYQEAIRRQHSFI